MSLFSNFCILHKKSVRTRCNRALILFVLTTRKNKQVWLGTFYLFIASRRKFVCAGDGSLFLGQSQHQRLRHIDEIGCPAQNQLLRRAPPAAPSAKRSGKDERRFAPSALNTATSDRCARRACAFAHAEVSLAAEKLPFSRKKRAAHAGQLLLYDHISSSLIISLSVSALLWSFCRSSSLRSLHIRHLTPSGPISVCMLSATSSIPYSP